MRIAPKHVVISLDKLEINSIETNSGVFIGSCNTAHGWSSHSKSNQGFGKMSDSTVTRCVGVVFDDDVVDSPINDADQFMIVHPKNEHAEHKIGLSDINVNALETNAAISVGEVDQIGWSSHSKSNSGEGRNKGINLSVDNASAIYDNDVVDAPIKSSGFFSGNSTAGDSDG